MVLAELGNKISGALRKLNKATVIDDKTINLCLKEIVNALLQADVNVKLVLKLRSNIQAQFKMNESTGADMRKLIQNAVLQEITKMLDSENEPFEPVKNKHNIIMFVGLQGSGKTTTCTKYASYYQKLGWRVALICADTFRAGAFDQLRQNAAKIHCPCYGSYSESDPVQISSEGVERFKEQNYEIIIVDTSGRHKQESALFVEMQQISAAIQPNNIIFTLDSSIGQACFDQALAFKQAVDVGSVIITKLDGHAKGGGSLSAVAATESPIIFIGTGEHFTQFEKFEPLSFVKRLLGFGDIKKMFDMVSNIIPKEDQAELMSVITTGKYTFRNMQMQYRSIMNMGSIGNFISLMPGIGNLSQQVNEEEAMKKMKKFLVMMDSMTDDELDSKVQFCDSRRRRISQGSGSHPMEFDFMMNEFQRLKKMLSGFAKSKLGKGNQLDQLQRNPNQIMKKMQNFMNPQMMKQLGGADNIMNMMKEAQAGGGMGEMKEMMQQAQQAKKKKKKGRKK